MSRNSRAFFTYGVHALAMQHFLQLTATKTTFVNAELVDTQQLQACRTAADRENEKRSWWPVFGGDREAHERWIGKREPAKSRYPFHSLPSMHLLFSPLPMSQSPLFKSVYILPSIRSPECVFPTILSWNAEDREATLQNVV